MSKGLAYAQLLADSVPASIKKRFGVVFALLYMLLLAVSGSNFFTIPPEVAQGLGLLLMGLMGSGLNTQDREDREMHAQRLDNITQRLEKMESQLSAFFNPEGVD